jgi:hypothetical protein
MRLDLVGKSHMPLFNVLLIVVCAWLLLLAITGVIEHVRLRRDEQHTDTPNLGDAG